MPVRASRSRSAIARRSGIAADIRLLQLDARACLLELALELLALVAVDALLDRLGGLVHERLGLLEAEAGGSADDLDHLDLLFAGAREDDVDRQRLLLGGGAVAASARGGRSGSDRLRGHAELFLERLDQLGQLEYRHLLDLFDQFCCSGHWALLIPSRRPRRAHQFAQSHPPRHPPRAPRRRPPRPAPPLSPAQAPPPRPVPPPPRGQPLPPRPAHRRPRGPAPRSAGAGSRGRISARSGRARGP